MKNKMIIGLAALLCAGGLQAQTNNVVPNISPGVTATAENIWQAIQAGTWAAGGGYERGLVGNKNIASGEVAYNFTNGIGVLFGNDVLFGKGKPQQETFKGGVSLQATIHPFAFIGSTSLTNLSGQIVVSDAIAQPNGNGNNIGNIVVTSLAIHVFDLSKIKLNNFDFVVAPNFENRQGQGNWSGNYFGVQLFLRRMF